MKNIATSFFLYFAATNAVSANDEISARELLLSWQPIDVSLNRGVLNVVLPEEQVTEKIYISIVTSGICIGPLTGKELDSVSEVQVLNRFSRQGYVYEAGTEGCEELNKIPVGDKMIDLLVAGKTRIFTSY